MRNYLGCCLWAAVSLLLTACGDSGNTTTPTAAEPAPTRTQFTVSVDLPANMDTIAFQSNLLRPAYADAVRTLTEQNFTAVWLDDKGLIADTIEISQWSTTGDGIYTLEAGTRPRINAVLLLDVKGIPEITLGETLPEGLYITPLATERLSITLESSLAYFALAKRVAQIGNWGVFEDVFIEAPQGKVLFAYQDINTIATDIRDTLFPKLGLQGLTLKDLMQLSLVNTMIDGRIERFFTEQAATEADIQAILNDGYWQISTENSNAAVGIHADQTLYDGAETTVNEFRWNKDGNQAISLAEFFTYFSNSTSFSTDDIQLQVLTNEGWTGMFNYLKVVAITRQSAVLTDAALDKEDEAGIRLSAGVYPLEGKRIHDFLSSKDNHYITRYIKPDAQFSAGSSGFYFTWRPENETYLLCDNTNGQDECRISPYAQPDIDYVTLDEVITPLEDVGAEIDSVNGFKLSDNIVVELIDDGFFTVRYWSNIAADEWTIQSYGVWASTGAFGQQLIRFDIPDIIRQLSDNYQFNSQKLFLVADRDFVHIGEVLLDGEEFNFSGFDIDAKEQIFAATSRDNLPPFGNCGFGNTGNANSDLYLNAVTECGGDERLTTSALDNLLDRHWVQISPDGEISAQILRDNNQWEQYRHTELETGSRSWSLGDEGYLTLTPDTNENGNYNRWALTSRDYDQRLLAFKQYRHLETGSDAPLDAIDNVMVRYYAADQLASCAIADSGWDPDTTTPVTKQTLTDYTNAAANCKQIWFDRDPRFTETLLVGQTGERSDDKALTFANDSSRYLKLSDDFSGDFFLGRYIDSDGCGFNFEIKWRLEDDGTLYYEALDGSMNERLQITDTDGLRLAIKAFNHQTRWQTDEALAYSSNEGEIWSDIITLIDAADVPDVTPIEAPPAEETPASEGDGTSDDGTSESTPPVEEDTGPDAGTILNDGKTCAYLPETPAP
ncbi:hypothetical protein [Photobacterium aquae]|uniref:hypothetical protein n=1 Tax=Photobacterium aquae TaxID=1195763 RepID=UPI00069F4139|nr:hypothetical protein [Photobacterium aquae]